MRLRVLRDHCYLALALLFALAHTVPVHAEEDSVLAEKAWRVLEKNCLVCHGAQAENTTGLDLHSREAILKGGKRGPAAVAGKADESHLIKAASHEDLQMPPGSKQPLPAEDLQALKDWINAGLPALARADIKTVQVHWAFQPVKKLDPPSYPTGWSSNEIDRFIQAKLVEKGIEPVGAAGRRALIRRAYFDLTGLPPSPEEIAAFVADDSQDAFATIVDKLLGSPRYGERWGRHWMDVVHYSDTAGDNADYPIPEVYRYRDYIIGSFNADKPYDEFVREQLAGDILAKQGPSSKWGERVAATGFLALFRRYGISPKEMWFLTMEDAIDTVGRALMGLTLRCARCHDHKFDPTTTQDYYALYGIFDSTEYSYTGSERLRAFNRRNFVPFEPPEVSGARLANYYKTILDMKEEADLLKQRLDEGDREALEQIAKIDAKLARGERLALQAAAEGLKVEKGRSEEIVKLLAEREEILNARKDKVAYDPVGSKQETAAEHIARIAELRKRAKALQLRGYPESLPMVYGAREGKIVNTRLHIQGDPFNQGKVIPRNVPAFLTGGKGIEIPEDSSGRLELAKWLTSPDHPLTARVMVNRIWHYHFGRGIVTTPSNFGLRGEPPTHPGLLDWLASRFVENGWSVKAMHRLIMLSNTYQISSVPSSEGAAKDPSNRYYGRFDRRRLDAEQIRDSMLLLGRNLDLERPGEHPFPPLEQWGYSQHVPFKAVYESNHRSVYLMQQRLIKHPYYATFDGPDTNSSTGKRGVSTVSLQALFMMNSDFVHEQAKGFARQLVSTAADPKSRVELAQEMAWGSKPSKEEAEKAVEYVRSVEDESQSAGSVPAEAELDAWSSYVRVLLTANRFFYID